MQEGADLVRLSYYPFLPQVREAVRGVAPALPTILTSPVYAPVRERAAQRIEGALGEGIPAAPMGDARDALQELLSVPIARMLCVHLGDRQLVSRYATAEARRVAAALARDEDPDSVQEVAATLGLTIQPVADEGEAPHAWRLHFSDYILLAPLSEPGWKLVARPVAAGWLELPAVDIARICQEALAKRIVAELDAEKSKPLPQEVITALAPYVLQLMPKLEEAREQWSEGDFGPVQPGLFPPCIKELFEMMRRGENVPHHGRFAFATFLGTVGWDATQIMDYMATLPNFDREKSRYQIEHVTGARGVDKYTPPGCATMQTNGVCPLDKRDGLCMKIKHPLSYYRAKLRFQRLDEERSAGSASPPGGPVATATDGPPAGTHASPPMAGSATQVTHG